MFYYIWKERTYKPLKVAPAKNFFSSVHVIDITSMNILDSMG